MIEEYTIRPFVYINIINYYSFRAKSLCPECLYYCLLFPPAMSQFPDTEFYKPLVNDRRKTNSCIVLKILITVVK